MTNRVFTFWEPKAALPGYVRLCLETWRKNLPGCEVVVLDYETLGDWLTPAEQEAVLWKGMTFAMQSDCIRCAVLKKHGGIWLDADTVLTRPLDERFARADVTMIARRMNGAVVNYGAFIRAARPEAKFLCDWHAALVGRVAKARRCRDSFWYGVFRHRTQRLMRRWDYCVNAIIDPLARTADAKDYAWIDKDEVNALMGLLLKYFSSEIDELDEKNVRILILGDVDGLPEAQRDAVNKAMQRTRDNTGLQLNIALNYGGHAELARAMRRLGDKIAKGEIQPDQIDETAIENELYTAGQPNVDLLIRTSGEKRLSNFLPWQLAYAEMIFDPVLWPDFDRAQYMKDLREYALRDRRFGGVKEG